VIEPAFLTRNQVLELHHSSVAHGGRDSLRDSALLDAALMQPEATYVFNYGDLAAIAAAYVFHLAESRPFRAGNLRVAVGAALTFLESNGADVRRIEGDKLHDALLALVEKRLDKSGLAAVFRSQLSA
jgi:death on curing protein